MKKEPSVTIFVPVKNSENTITKCINSLLNLDYKNKKIFVIDNISDDNTYEILKNYNKKINLIKMPGTVPKLHNFIIRHTKAQFIAYTNSDCVVKKNWLKKLISSFGSKDIVATTGYCATPRGLNKLQTIIGKELESRFLKSPAFVYRGPDMNLCVRTNFAKKVMFDDRFIWSWESDFGYRLTKLGKMKYVPSAIVYHYHRPTLIKFFRQQFNNALINIFLYWKHKDKILGDHISTTSMALTLGLSFILSLSLILSLLNVFFLKVSIISFIVLFLLYFKEIVSVSSKIEDSPLILTILIVRTIAWMLGWPAGLFLFFKRGWYKNENTSSR